MAGLAQKASQAGADAKSANSGKVSADSFVQRASSSNKVDLFNEAAKLALKFVDDSQDKSEESMQKKIKEAVKQTVQKRLREEN